MNARAVAIVWMVFIGLISFDGLAGQKGALKERRVVIESDGWNLVGDLCIPPSNRLAPAVIMLNRAAATGGTVLLPDKLIEPVWHGYQGEGRRCAGMNIGATIGKTEGVILGQRK